MWSSRKAAATNVGHEKAQPSAGSWIDNEHQADLKVGHYQQQVGKHLQQVAKH